MNASITTTPADVTGRQLSDLDIHFLTAAAADLGKFISAHATWLNRIDNYKRDEASFKAGSMFVAPVFPKGRPSDKAKWNAYDAASQVSRVLGLTDRAHDVPGLAMMFGLAIAAVHGRSYAPVA